ncbi:MAG TPA: outer membrane lipoprotein-sorting protein [Candidatus Limnocylindria bacterium]|nr:outer membrane lipoprotein-sorting protein [Candidatus Limnocylindria bacterium]
MTLSRWLAAVIIGAAVVAGSTAASAQSALEIMQKQRELHRAKDEEEVLALKLVDRHGAVKQRRIVRYTATAADGLSKILVRFLAPRDIENTGLLTWEAADGDDDQWLFLPAARKAKRIAASGKKNRFMGTDFAFEDLRPEALAANRYALLGSEVLEGQDCHVIEAVPATERQAADSGYSKRKLWVRKDTLYIMKREFYDKKGRLEKVQIDRQLVNVKGPMWRANEIEMRDVQSEGRTVLSAERRAVDTGLKPSLFTESELTRGGS